MKAFVAFVIVLFLLLGAVGGYLYWDRQQKIVEWGLRLDLGVTYVDTEVAAREKRFNEVLDEDEVLLAALEKHDLSSFYDLSSKEEVLVRFREDTFVRISQGRFLDILFLGPRKSRREREVVVGTLSQVFVERVTALGEG